MASIHQVSAEALASALDQRFFSQPPPIQTCEKEAPRKHARRKHRSRPARRKTCDVGEHVASLGSSEMADRYHAAEALAALGPKAENARVALMKALVGDDSAYVRKSAALALGELGHCPCAHGDAHTHAVLIFTAQHDEDKYVRERVGHVLKALDVQCNGAESAESSCAKMLVHLRDASRSCKRTWPLQELEELSTADPSPESSLDGSECEPDIYAEVCITNMPRNMETRPTAFRSARRSARSQSRRSARRSACDQGPEVPAASLAIQICPGSSREV